MGEAKRGGSSAAASTSPRARGATEGGVGAMLCMCQGWATGAGNGGAEPGEACVGWGGGGFGELRMLGPKPRGCWRRRDRDSRSLLPACRLMQTRLGRPAGNPNVGLTLSSCGSRRSGRGKLLKTPPGPPRQWRPGLQVRAQAHQGRSDQHRDKTAGRARVRTATGAKVLEEANSCDALCSPLRLFHWLQLVLS